MNTRKDLSPALAALEGALGPARGKKYWRTLEELADSPAFRELMRLEFPDQADVWPDGLSRRRFLALMGASLALAGLGGCSTKPAASVEVLPYVKQPEELVPGKPLFFATAMTVGGAGVGLLVENHMGRPTKIEGNPDHPGSLGATDPTHQASILQFYDPDRSQTVVLLGRTSTWDAALGELPVQGIPSVRRAAADQRGKRGSGLRLLTETVVSPTLYQQIGEFLKAFPEARRHQYEPLADDAGRRAVKLAYGDFVNTIYDFTKADVVVSLDADFLGCSPSNLRYVADFMSRRRVRTTDADAAKAQMNRLYVVEPGVSCTGAKADHRLAVRARDVEGVARSLAAKLGVMGGDTAGAAPPKWIDAVSSDLQQHRGRSLVLAGPGQPEAVHLLALAINHHLGNVGQTVLHTASVESQPVDQLQSLRELVDDMERGQVEMLLILGGNPVFSAPADFDFAERMKKVPLRVHLGLYQDETSRLCHWHLPEAHYLEAWGDTRAYDGTASIVQPLIRPLYQGRSAHEFLSALIQETPTPGYELVRGYWRKHWEGRGPSSGSFEDFWQTALHDGVVEGTALPHKTVSLRPGWQDQKAPAGGGGEYELVFRPDPMIYDGRFANNGWLQECPRPITTLTWDNAALMSPKTAAKLGAGGKRYAHGGEHGGYHVPVVELQVGDRKVEAPVWVVPGHVDDSITVSLGYGRQYAGRVGGSPDDPVGFNAYLLRTSGDPWFTGALAVRKTTREHLLACTQEHQLMENRDVVRAGTLDEYHDKPRFAAEKEKELEKEETRRSRKPLTLYPPSPAKGATRKWGMAIDLTACVGCKACVVACQAENNIPVVGKDQVSRGREMHWLRVDLYHASGSEPVDMPTEFHFQPVPCMHCEDAPCEYVCPVEATVHSKDGLNDMIYQRCVGTRFCSNNCPYKVRRFNWYDYNAHLSETELMVKNPNVTVRERGV
ncbi:MAG TPA: TAT-variant-translocated molybdopterin oxidoreductase, partial [Gemmataceae bacterium]|nr:TAT-variant-translocated molybdopterin oxidoreductase [Gemmataceae bacterium]